MIVLSPCPSQQDLRQFLGGQSSHNDFEAILSHLEQCEHCCAVAEKSLAGDTLLEAIRARKTMVDGAANYVPGLIQRLLRLTVSRERSASPPSLLELEETAQGLFPPPPVERPPVAFLVPPLAPDELGRLGSYRILKKVGEGGMGAVFQAEDMRLKRIVALKVIKPDVASVPEIRERFFREAQAVAKLEHENIVTVYQVDVADGIPFLAMQWLKGQNLEDRLRSGAQPNVQQILRLGKQIAHGLQVAHEAGLVHRDIKPANLWLEPIGGGRIKILDFGLAHVESREVGLTQSGAILGTPSYMAPEQARGLKATPRCDLFGLGVVLYRLCTGALPFRGENSMAVLASLLSDEPEQAGKLAPTLPPALTDLVMRLLDKDPARRPATACEVAECLDAIGNAVAGKVDDSPTMASAPSELQRAEPVKAAPVKPARRGPWRAAALAACVALAVLLPLGYFFGATVIRHVTNKGVLVVEVDDPNVEVVVKQDDVVIRDEKRKREFVLTAGDGEIQVFEKDGIRLATKKFTLVRGGKETVVVRLEDVRAAKAKEPVVVAGDDRKAAEWVLSIGGVVVLRVKDQERRIDKGEELPTEPFLLTWTDLSHNAKVSDAGLAHFKGCKNLARLDLSGTRVSDSGLAHFANCKNLTYLNLYNTLVSDAGVAHFKDCKNLTQLYLFGTRVSNTGLALFRGCKNLTGLDLGGTQVSGPGLAHFEDCKNLTYLNLNGTKVSDSELALFESCKSLTQLYLAGTRVSDSGLALFGDCKNLKDLELGETQVSNAGLALFRDCKKLVGFGLAGTKVSDAGLAHFKDYKSLARLDLRGTQVSNAGLAHFEDCKNLTSLDLTNTQVSNAGLAHFKGCMNLTILHLHGTQISDEGLAHLRECRSLTKLVLTGTQVSDAGLAHLEKCKNLASLELSHTKVSDAGLAHLGNCKNLTELGLDNTKVSDAGLAHLRDCKKLTGLELSRTKVSNASVELLASFPRLHLLHLDNTRLSKASHDLLKTSMMPTANIIWSEPNRSAALAVLALGGTVHIRATARGEDKPIKAAADLPDAYFRVSRVSLARVEKPLSDLCSKLALLDDSEFDSLTEFDLAGSSFTNEDLARLGSQKRATHLSLSGPKVSQDGLAHLKNWPALQRLTLDGLELRGPDLSPLKRLAELTELRLGCKTLTDLFAVQLGELKTLAKLEKLSLAGSAIGDETLKRLHDFPALKELDLTGIKVSAEAVIAAKKALPNCKIIGPGK